MKKVILVSSEDNWYLDIYVDGHRIGNVANDEDYLTSISILLRDLGIEADISGL